MLDIPVLDRFIDPHALSSFPIFSYESPRQLTDFLLNEWTAGHIEEDQRKPTNKMLQQVVVPLLESLSSKEELVMEAKLC